MHEQVAIAALDASALPFAASLIRAVARRFPTASRTRRLQVSDAATELGDSNYRSLRLMLPCTGKPCKCHAFPCRTSGCIIACLQSSPQGMYWEASGNTDKAAELYNEALDDKPGDEIIAKRLVRHAMWSCINELTRPEAPFRCLQIAVEKTRGNTQAAVEALRKYLDIYAGDKDAWEELGELYLEVRSAPLV